MHFIRKHDFHRLDIPHFGAITFYCFCRERLSRDIHNLLYMIIYQCETNFFSNLAEYIAKMSYYVRRGEKVENCDIHHTPEKLLLVKMTEQKSDRLVCLLNVQ